MDKWIEEIEKLRAENAQLKVENDEELGRWQQEIYKLVIKLSGCEVDGSGCDSGDPLDLTLAEIEQGFSFVTDQNTEQNKELLEACKLLIDFFPSGWAVPLGWGQVIAQVQEAIKKAGEK